MQMRTHGRAHIRERKEEARGRSIEWCLAFECSANEVYRGFIPEDGKLCRLSNVLNCVSSQDDPQHQCTKTINTLVCMEPGIQ